MMKSQEADPGRWDQERDLSSVLERLDRGLSYLVQRRLNEGMDLLCQVRDQLPVEQGLLRDKINGLQEATTELLRAEQTLQEASRRFVNADREYQSYREELITYLRATHISPFVPVPSGPFAHSLLPGLSDAPAPSRQNRSSPLAQADHVPPLYISCFGRFVVRRFDVAGLPVELCRNLKGQAILRYLVTQPDQQASIDMLMADLWPEEDTETARHKLQVAVSALRCSLNREYVQSPGGGYILCKNRVYQLNPSIVIRTDVAEFLTLYQEGGQVRNPAEAAICYERACQLYTGPFLTEDLYAEWSFLMREELTKAYLAMCSKLAEYNLESGNYKATIAWAQAILKIDRCDEHAYRLLIRAYAALGQRSEVLRRYQQCQQALAEELGVSPMQETQQLLQTILHQG